MEKELKKLYDSEINIRITSFWDGGWYVCLGDEMNGYQNPDWGNCDLEEIVIAIRQLAKKHYPDSKYVWDMKPWYRKLFKKYEPVTVLSHEKH